MKKLLSLFISLAAIVSAQAPNSIPYQGVARNAAGNILATQTISLRVSIHDVTAGGTVNCTASTPVYDFSSAAGMAIGDNEALLETGIWGMYTGDINQDDFIDGNDFPQYDSESASGGLYDGTYTATDMNGDGFVDGNDFPVFDGNSSIGVSAAHLNNYYKKDFGKVRQQAFTLRFLSDFAKVKQENSGSVLHSEI